MAPTNKAKAAGVSAGSFLELRAQVAKQKEGLAKGSTTAVVGKKKDGKVRKSCHPFARVTHSPAHRNRTNGHSQTKAFRAALLETWSRKS